MSRRSYKQNLIGFPPGLLRDTPLRIPIISETENWIAFGKPTGVGVRKHPWDVGIPDMDTALNRQLEAGKPELIRLKATLFGSVY